MRSLRASNLGLDVSLKTRANIWKGYASERGRDISTTTV